MKNLFDGEKVDEVKGRLMRLGPAAERQWGTMDAAQAVAHCSAGMEMAVGDKRLPRILLGRLLGAWVKPKVLGDDAPMRRNSPTDRSLVMGGARDLDLERKRLCELIDRFSQGGPAGCTTHPHSFFGPLTPEEWAILMYKHLDHHLRQFGL